MVPGACDNLVGGAVRASGGCPRLGDCFFDTRSRARGIFPPSAHSRVESAMTPQKGKKFRTSDKVDLTITHRHAAGIDVHSAVHFVAVPVEDVPTGFLNPDAKLPAGVRKFGANT